MPPTNRKGLLRTDRRTKLPKNNEIKYNPGNFDRDVTRLRNENPTVSDLVYQYLENIQDIDTRRMQRSSAGSRFRKAHVRRCRFADFQPRKNWVPGLGRNRNLDRSHVPRFTRFPNLPTEWLIESSLLRGNGSSRESILKYGKVVEEGRKMARRYVRKAVSFGIQAGYLLPRDEKGETLHVSSDLGPFRVRRKKPAKSTESSIHKDLVPAIPKRRRERILHPLKNVRRCKHNGKQKQLKNAT
ncbi:uncharacterized protein LOC105703684 [Orussus abietinus]|uniref:uncharacterized protein LOC105703684 n=1 Tax=Orussus abietinus TaxID=222816 RepID=UPI000626AD32|nr:uncharacterized protein LOC105703684 [Orussus abietinus]XP_023287712.1 uncharacterized protein LOC105703684 [Orussus abietinus]XP_023287713.1 uncharacterized protein LOC105703684 [Orussus abietinus]